MNIIILRALKEHIDNMRSGERVLVGRLANKLNLSRVTIIRYLDWIYAVGKEFPKDQQIILKMEKNQQGCKIKSFYKK